MNLAIAGAIMMAFSAVGLFFFKFWLQTRDRLLGCFALAFWMFALERASLTFLVERMDEVNPLVYSMRLCGFVLILVGIMEKNRVR